MSGLIRRRHFLASSAAAFATLAAPRSSGGGQGGGEILFIDFVAQTAKLAGRPCAMEELVDGQLRIATAEVSGGLYAGLLCESRSARNPAAIVEPGTPIGWRLHPPASSIGVATSTDFDTADIHFTGDGNGLHLLIMGTLGQGLDIDSGSAVRFGATVSLLGGNAPEQLSWVIVEEGSGPEPVILHHVPLELTGTPYIDRQFVRSTVQKNSLHLALAFVAGGRVDFKMRITGPQLVADEHFKFVSPAASDQNRLKEAAGYFASASRRFELSGLGPVNAGGMLYSETGEESHSDSLVLGVDQDYRAYLRIVSHGKEVAFLRLGEVVPLQPWRVSCVIDTVRNTVEIRWGERLIRATLATTPVLHQANIGFFESDCAECLITAVKLVAVGPIEWLPTSAIRSQSLYDDFERTQGGEFGVAPTGHRWMKSRPLDAPDFAIATGSYVAVDSQARPIATYLKTDLGWRPSSMGAVVSFEGNGEASAVALICSTEGFPRIGDGGSNAIHNVFAVDRAYFGVALNGALIDLGPSREYPEPLERTGVRYGVGWYLQDDRMTLLLPGGYFHRMADRRFAQGVNREVIFELYRKSPFGSTPTIHAVSAI